MPTPDGQLILRPSGRDLRTSPGELYGFIEQMDLRILEFAQKRYDSILAGRAAELEEKQQSHRDSYPVFDQARPWKIQGDDFDWRAWGDADELRSRWQPVEELKALFEGVRSMEYANEAQIKTIKRIYVELGMASMLLWEDWKVNRLEDIYSNMGVKDLNDAQKVHLSFLTRIGALENQGPAIGRKLVSLTMGCGTGESMEATRANTDVRFGPMSSPTSKYFEEVGLADKIYFPLAALLKNHLVSAEAIDCEDGEAEICEEVLAEFAEVLCSWILESYSTQKGSRKKNFELLQLPKEVNPIRNILRNMEGIIKNVRDRIIAPNRSGSLEFEGDSKVDISPRCRTLLKSIFIKHTRDIESLFDDRFFDEDVDLREEIAIHPKNVCLSLFQNAKEEAFEGMPPVHIAYGRRSTSHLDDKDFSRFILDVCDKLAPGGCIFADDGIRESYTRYERIDALRGLQVSLSSEFRICVSTSSENPGELLSFHIQRAYVDAEGNPHFYDDNEMQSLLRNEGAEWRSIHEQEICDARKAFQQEVIFRIRGLFVGSEDEHQGAFDLINHGRRKFAGLHDAITEECDKAFEADGNMDEAYEAVIAKLAARYKKVANALEVEANGGLRRKHPDYDVIGFGYTNSMASGLPDAALSGPKYPFTYIPRNADIRGFSEIVELGWRQYALELASKIQAETRCSVFVNYLFEDCFTNDSMRRSFENFLGERGVRQFVENKIVERGNPNSISTPYKHDGQLVILGGGLDDSYSSYGDRVVSRLRHYVHAYKEGMPGAFYGICLGDQCMRIAYADVMGYDCHSGPGALQIGFFPVQLRKVDSVAAELHQKRVAMAFTRLGHVHIPELDNDSRVTPWALFPHHGKAVKRDPIGLSIDLSQAHQIMSCSGHPEGGNAVIPDIERYIAARASTWTQDYNPHKESDNPAAELRGECSHQVSIRAFDRWDRDGILSADEGFREFRFVRRKSFAALVVPQLILQMEETAKALGIKNLPERPNSLSFAA